MFLCKAGKRELMLNKACVETPGVDDSVQQLSVTPLYSMEQVYLF